MAACSAAWTLLGRECLPSCLPLPPLGERKTMWVKHYPNAVDCLVLDLSQGMNTVSACKKVASVPHYLGKTSLCQEKGNLLIHSYPNAR